MTAVAGGLLQLFPDGSLAAVFGRGQRVRLALRRQADYSFCMFDVTTGDAADAEPEQDLWNRQRREAKGDERPGVRPRPCRRDAAPQYHRPDLRLRRDRGGE